MKLAEVGIIAAVPGLQNPFGPELSDTTRNHFSDILVPSPSACGRGQRRPPLFDPRGERYEIALEPHWFRVQTERIKRCNSQAKKDY
ncbi:BQ5605_C004g02763 [Microbotryum silenes-dioicae]|uniref:BQ5605_C004g02763 protein n=1 Tax=Microbotryum silenes-dioicae TaxID=796604 RepID=A0A2X0M8T2_9BASI|nr:BQ5605_C004g02763 [Microbotryum silenes-dioicae]